MESSSSPTYHLCQLLLLISIFVITLPVLVGATSPEENEALCLIVQLNPGLSDLGWGPCPADDPCGSWNDTTNTLLCTDNNVTKISLATNSFSQLPTQIGNLQSLTFLLIDSSTLSGTLPTQIGSLTNLMILSVRAPEVSGTIPTQIAKLTDLTNLYLNCIYLSGTIPIDIFSLPYLINFNLLTIYVSGVVPSQIGQMRNLTYLYLSSSLSGQIPTELGYLTNLQYLSLIAPAVSGTIPTQLGELKYISYLYLSIPSISGTIPNQIGELTDIKFMYINADICGCLPQQWNDFNFNYCDLRAIIQFCNCTINTCLKSTCVSTCNPVLNNETLPTVPPLVPPLPPPVPPLAPPTSDIIVPPVPIPSSYSTLVPPWVLVLIATCGATVLFFICYFGVKEIVAQYDQLNYE